MKKELSDYSNPYEANEEFEKAIAEFTGAKGVIVTDSHTHAIELGLRYAMPKMYSTIPPNVHFSIPMTLANLGIEYMFSEDNWENEFRINGSTVYSAARYFKKDMFELANPAQKKIVCVSFADDAPLAIGHGGAILTNDRKAYDWLKVVANDGRDLTIKHWEDQKQFNRVGYHYGMRPADAIIGLDKLANGEIGESEFGHGNYPDLRGVVINK